MRKKEDQKPSHNPLLYIEQPQFECAKPTMQQVFQTSRTKNKEEVKEETKEGTIKAKKKRNISVEPLGFIEEGRKDQKEKKNSFEVEKKEEVMPVKSKSKPRFKPLKPFKDMDVDERLDYLKPFIGKPAPFICMFVFKDETQLKGVLSECHDNTIGISIKEGEQVHRNRDELVNIFIS